MIKEKVYTEEQVKKAFWDVFHESGEIWFNYLGNDKENNESTDCYWKQFKQIITTYMHVSHRARIDKETQTK